MEWPKYYKDKLHIANSHSNVGVITLWTPMQAILPNLNQENFSIGGQLYSKRGINFIIRNILANPTIDTLLICGANRSESAEAVLNLIDKGIDKDHNIIGVDKAVIDKEIPLQVLNEFRKNVRCIDLIGNSNYAKIDLELSKITKKENSLWRKPEIFAEPEISEAEKYPSERNLYTVRGGYIKDVWPQAIKRIMRFGSEKGMIKVGKVKEIVNLVTVVEEEDPNNPDLAEWFNFTKDDLKLYYKGFFEKETKTEDYGYGARMFSYPLGLPTGNYKSLSNNNIKTKLNSKKSSFNQIEEIYLKLKNYKYDRGGIISIWNPWIDNVATGWMSDSSKSNSGNVPCMTQLQFAYRERRLMLTAYFRSNDIFDAWPRNAFALRKLQFELAKKLKMEPGFLTVISSLAQIYENNFEEAKKLLDKFENKIWCRYDPRGNIIIEIDGTEIVIKHMDTSGNEILKEYRVDGKRPKAAQIACDLLDSNLIFSEFGNAMDIARELQKAEIAIKEGGKFTQDRELVFK